MCARPPVRWIRALRELRRPLAAMAPFPANPVEASIGEEIHIRRPAMEPAGPGPRRVASDGGVGMHGAVPPAGGAQGGKWERESGRTALLD